MLMIVDSILFWLAQGNAEFWLQQIGPNVSVAAIYCLKVILSLCNVELMRRHDHATYRRSKSSCWSYFAIRQAHFVDLVTRQG